MRENLIEVRRSTKDGKIYVLRGVRRAMVEKKILKDLPKRPA
jgi:hypothetical protein